MLRFLSPFKISSATQRLRCLIRLRVAKLVLLSETELGARLTQTDGALCTPECFFSL